MSGRIIPRLITALTICIQAPLTLGQTKRAPSTSPETIEKSLPFETIKLRSSGFGQHKEKAQYVIRNKKEWDAMWRNAQPRWPERQLRHPHPLPPDDFEKEMVLAAFHGTCSSTGHSVGIEEVRDAGDKLIAVVKQRTPAPWQATGDMMTYPSHLIRLPKSDKPVCFQVMTIKYPKRTPRKPGDGPIDPYIYKELKGSPDGKASMWIFLKQPEMPQGATMEEREAIIKELHDSVFSKLKPDEFEYGTCFGGTSSDLTGRISASGLEKLSKDPNFKSAMFEGPSSLPEKFVVEQDCE